jgi:O-antigen ligase
MSARRMPVPAGGRRGGLARAAAELTPRYLPAPDVAGRPAFVSELNFGTLRRVAWSISYAAFLLYIIAVVTNRFSIGTYAIPVALVGVLFEGRGLRVPAFLGWMGALFVWAAMGVVASAYPGAVADAVMEYGKLVLIMFAGANALRTSAHVRVYMAVVVASFLAYPGKGTVYNYLTGSVRHGRAAWGGIYNNPNDLAAIALLMLSVTVALLAFRLPKWARLGGLAAIGFIAFVMLITQSRGALIALSVFAIALLWRSRGRQRGRVIVGLVAAVAALVFYAPEGVWDRLSGLRNVTNTEDLSAVDAEGSAEQRYEIWKVARTVAAENPVLGVGLDAYKFAHGQTVLRGGFGVTARGNRDAHNTYLTVLAETGVPGLAIFVAIIVTTFTFCERVRRRAVRALPAEARALVVMELGFVAFLVAGIWGSYSKLHFPYLHLLLLWSLAEVTRRELARRDAGLPAAPVAR